MREKLIELLREVQYQGNAVHGYSDKYIQNGELADHLIANGVTLESYDCHWATETAFKNGYAQGMKDAVKWIPVTERLPETFGEYIVAVKALDDTTHSDYADYDPFQQRWTTGLYRCPKEEVTHWMPLPEPPKGE